MGSEDLFHKRKAKTISDLDRLKGKRAQYDKILIVCEGEKTEPLYFKDLIQFYELNTANVEVDGDCGSSPKSVYEKAVELHDHELKKGDGYDKVYCVFDKDLHETYAKTIDIISRKIPENVFLYTRSVPCFEYWLLLHFQSTTKPYAPEGGKSMGDQVMDDLKVFMPKYKKGESRVFTTLSEQLEFATHNALRAKENALSCHTDNPSTDIHELVKYLKELKLPSESDKMAT